MTNNSPKLFKLALIGGITAAAFTSASAQNTLINGDLSVPTTWDSGLPDSSGNVGIIDNDNLGPNAGSVPGTGLTGLFINQTGGFVSNSGGIDQTLDSVEYDISGGTLKLESLTLINGTSLTVSGGAVELNLSNNRDFKVNESTFTISGGSFALGDQAFGTNSGSAAGNVFNFEGGTFTSGSLASGFNNQGTFNFSGTADVNTGSSGGSNNDRFFNIGLGTGTIDFTGTLNTQNMTIDWSSGSQFEFTANTIGGNSATTWEELWDQGVLLVDGAKTGGFTDNFQVSENTLSLAPVPEPATYALLAGLLGLTWVMTRRRA